MVATSRIMARKRKWEGRVITVILGIHTYNRKETWTPMYFIWSKNENCFQYEPKGQFFPARLFLIYTRLGMSPCADCNNSCPLTIYIFKIKVIVAFILKLIPKSILLTFNKYKKTQNIKHELMHAKWVYREFIFIAIASITREHKRAWFATYKQIKYTSVNSFPCIYCHQHDYGENPKTRSHEI
jgi:hypothetical protein